MKWSWWVRFLEWTTYGYFRQFRKIRIRVANPLKKIKTKTKKTKLAALILESGSCYSIYQPLLLLLCFLSFFSINTPLCIYISPSIPDENVVAPLALGLFELRHPSLFYLFLMSVQVHLLWTLKSLSSVPGITFL